MKIVLLIRREKNYFLNNKLSLGNIVSPPHDQIIYSFIFYWNCSFKMRYMDFRNRLKDIAFSTFKKNNFDDIIMYFDDDRIRSLEPGTLVVPIDEDDWFSSSLVEELKNISDPFEVVHWDTYIKNVKGKFYPYGRYRRVDSCCYGVKVPCDINTIKWHMCVNINRAYHLSKRLSVRIITSASIGVFLYWSSGDYITFRKDMVNNTIKDINSLDIFPGEYKQEVILYKELLKELLSSARFDIAAI